MRKFSFIAICNIICLPALSSIAQGDNRVVLSEKMIPQVGVKITYFVPKGWKIEQELKGDLNADLLKDVVLQLIEDRSDQDSKGEYVGNRLVRKNSIEPPVAQPMIEAVSAISGHRKSVLFGSSPRCFGAAA